MSTSSLKARRTLNAVEPSCDSGTSSNFAVSGCCSTCMPASVKIRASRIRTCTV